MSNCDYFLIHRAMQIHQLWSDAQGQTSDLPDFRSRWGLPRDWAAFLKSVDSIIQLPFLDGPKEGMLARVSKLAQNLFGSSAEDEEDSQPRLLSDDQRSLLIDFESNLVRLRLSNNSDTASDAGRIVQAILLDHEFFFGLKPLAQYPEDFFYEQLFPSWFNLYTAMVSRSTDGHPRFSDERIRVVFGFLEQWLKSAPDRETQMVVALTFIANRYEPRSACRLLQLLIDLGSTDDPEQRECRLETLWYLIGRSPSAPELTRHVENILVVQSCLYPTEQHEFEVAEERIPRPEIPNGVAECLRELGNDKSRFSGYVKMTSHIAAVVDGAAGFSPGLTKLLNNKPAWIGEALELVVHDESGEALVKPVQDLVAILLESAGAAEEIDFTILNPCVHDVLTRTVGLSNTTRQLLTTEFLQRDANRQALVGGCRDANRRGRLVTKLLGLAQKSSDDMRFLDLLSIAAVVSAEIDASQLDQTQIAINVLQYANRDQTIGRNELQDIIGDLRQNLPESLSYLGRTIQTATTKPERLARLYLALNEECEQFRSSGRVSNFGLTRAGYSMLSRRVDDDPEKESET